MNNKRIQANMQLNIEFIAKPEQLLKQIKEVTKNLNLEPNFTKPIGENLKKSIQDAFSALDKMKVNLSKPGLSTKEYTEFFTLFNSKLIESVSYIQDLKKHLSDAYKSGENKQAIKELDQYKQKLKEVKEIASSQSWSKTNRETLIEKLKSDYQLDYTNSATKGRLKAMSDRLTGGLGFSKQQIKWGSNLGFDEEQLKNIVKLYDTIEKRAAKIVEYNIEASKIGGKSDVDKNIQYLESQIETLNKSIFSSDLYKENIKIADSAVKAANALNTEANAVAEVFPSEVVDPAVQRAERMAEASQTLQEIFRQFGITFSAATFARMFKELIDSSFQFYKSLDSALNQIYVVSNLSSRAVSELTSNFIDMSKKTGMAIDDVTKAAVLFYQQGLRTDEVLTMTEVTSQFAKVAGIDAADAADKLTAAVNGYRLAASDASSVADKFNKVAAVSAADINELSTAFSKAAAQANQAGVSMDNYLAYIATMEEATREAPENIGTSLKTIFSRMQQIKTGNNTEDSTDVNQVETALKTVGIQLRDVNGQLRDLEEIFNELGPRWNNLDRNTQAYIGTIVAGTRQQSRFITLMQNWDRVLELSEESANSAGQQALMHAKAMDSIESKLQRLSVAWQEFVSNLSDSSIIKSAISSITKLLDIVNSGTKPWSAMSIAIGLFGKQINKVITSIIGDKAIPKLKQLFDNIRDNGVVRNIVPVSVQKAASSARIKGYDRKIASNENRITELHNLQEELHQNTKIDSKKKEEEITKEIADLTQKIRDLEQDRSREQEKLNRLKRNEKNNIREELTQEDIGNFVTGAGTAVTMLGSLMPGNAGTTISGVGSMASGIGRMIASGGFDIAGAIQAAIGLTQVVMSISDEINNVEQHIEESAAKVGESLENLSSRKVEEKNAKNLLQKYDTLYNKIYKTAAEQEKLNDYAQQLGDTLDIDVLTDAYGNLSVSIDAVNEKIKELETKTKSAREELSKTEREEIEKYDHLGRVADFYKKYLESNRSDLRGIISDIDTGLKTTEYKASVQTVQSLMSNLKDAAIDASSEISDAFGGIGIHWTLTEDVESIIQSFNNANINSDQWNSLYNTINNLQESLDNMSYDRALTVVENAIQAWGSAAKLTTEQINMMKDAIMNTLYSDSNLNKTVSKYQEIIDKGNKSYYKNRIDEYTRQRDEARTNSTSIGNPFYEDEYEREYESAQNKISLTEQQLQAYRELEYIQRQINDGYTLGITLAGRTVNLEQERKELIEKYKLVTDEDIQKAEFMLNIVTRLSDTTAQWLSNAGLFDENAEGILQLWKDSGIMDNIINAFSIDENAGKEKLTSELVKIIQSTDDADMKKAAEEKLTKVFKSISITGITTWTELGESLDTMTEDLRSINSLMEDFKETGGFTLDTFKDLASILDSMNLSELYDAGKLDTFVDSIEKLKLGFDESTGVITANGDALKNLQDIQQALTQAKIEAQIKSLEADKAQLQSQIFMVEAEMKSNELLATSLEKKGELEIKVTDLQEMAQADYSTNMRTAANNAVGLYATMVKASSKWAEATIANAVQVGEAIKQAMQGNLGKENLQAYVTNLVKELQYKDTGSYAYVEMRAGENGTIRANEAARLLREYNQKGENTIKDLQSQMKAIDTMKNLLTSMKDADLGKFGSSGSSDSGSTKTIDKYIGKLKEIYNILNRIDVLEHRLSTLDAYAEVAQGEYYGNLLKERIGYNQELLDQYEFLTVEQKKFTNGYKDFIGSVEGLEGVFDFDKFGQIIINWDKYMALQDEAIDGETTLKEKADDVYDTYTQMFEDLQGYFDKTIDYYKQVIKLHQEVVDAYMDMQDKAAAAVKEIYQRILDTKLDAIDQEKDALDELQKARERARKDQENAKAVSNLQTNMQRALMDTSGASDTAFIKAQKDINDKLEKIADDKYSQMLDDIKEKLDEEKDALQKEFNDMFDQLDWLHSWLDEDIMMNQDALINILQQTDSWRQESFLHREEDLADWNTKYHTYYSSVLENEKGIYGIYDEIVSTKERIAILDKNLQTSISQAGATIWQTYEKWNDATNKAINNLATSVANGGIGGNGNNNNTNNNNINNQNDNNNKVLITITFNDGMGGIRQETHYVGDTVSLPALSRSGYKFGGWNVPSIGQCRYGSYKATVTETVTALWEKQTVTTSNSTTNTNSNYKPVFTQPGKLLSAFASGGYANFTGPAWMDGSITNPEAVLTPLQTKHFATFTNALDKMFSAGDTTTNVGGNVTIDNISFNVASMSSPEDGEAAFNMFVNKFKEIGSQTGLKINTFKNTL